GPLHVLPGRVRAVVKDVAPRDVEAEEPPLEAGELDVLVVHSRHRVESAGVDDEPGELLHDRTVDPGAEVEVGAPVQRAGAVAGDEGEVLLGRLDEVHGGHVCAFHFGFATKENAEEGRDDPPSVPVVDEYLPRTRGVAAVPVRRGGGREGKHGVDRGELGGLERRRAGAGGGEGTACCCRVRARPLLFPLSFRFGVLGSLPGVVGPFVLRRCPVATAPSTDGLYHSESSVALLPLQSQISATQICKSDRTTILPRGDKILARMGGGRRNYGKNCGPPHCYVLHAV
ncbi:hypothetical protein THAOC_05234, partial [Thalassiosira oceanica]